MIGVGSVARSASARRHGRAHAADGVAFFPAFLGTLIAGAVPVPIYPPFRPDQIEEYARRQRAILRNAGARVLVTFAEALRVAKLLRGAVPAFSTS